MARGTRSLDRGNWIEAAAAERMTTQQPPDRESTAAQRTVCCNRYRRVLGTRWNKPASSALAKRVRSRRKPATVELEYGEKDACHGADSALPDRGELAAARACSAFACV